MEPVAVVIGDMDLVRPLGLAGITCVAAGPTGTETRWSRYTHGSLDLPDLWDEPEQTVEVLIEFARRQDQKSVLFYQKDPALLTISRFREELGRWFDFIVPDRDTVEDLVDKERFRRRAQELGLPAPISVVATPGSSPVPTDVRFPVIVKPVLRSRPLEAWRPIAGRAKAVLCQTHAELRELWDRAEIHDVSLIVQRYVPGDETTIVSYHVFIDGNGAVIGDFCGRKIRTLPPEFGISTAVEIIDLPDVRSVGLEVLKAFDFTGVAKVDLKESPEGELHLLEVNPRFNLWHHPGAMAGVNLPAAIYAYLTKGTSSLLPAAESGMTWVQPWGDARAAHAAGLTLTEWLRFVRRCGARRAFHANDPGSVLGAVNLGILQMLGVAPRQ